MPVIITLVKSLIKFYQMVVSPFLGTNCRFIPSCSHYSNEAISTHGLGKGILLTLKRIMRCHPFAKPGYDPVPPVTLKTKSQANEKY